MFTIQNVYVNAECRHDVGAYSPRVPRLWNETIEAHRRDVRDAILDTTWTLASEHGPASVKMSEIAEKTGIGRATLYKYFPDVEAILAAWHHRQINRHLVQLAEVRDQTGDPSRRLHAVIEAYARIHQRRAHHRDQPHGAELATLLHQDDQVTHAQQQLRVFFRDLLGDAARTGHVRDDINPDELAAYCLHALTAASALPSDAAIQRLVTVTLAGLHPAP
jgi:AcrR family transcriptional regulator